MSASRCYQMQTMLPKSPTFCLGCLLDWSQMGFLRFFYFFSQSCEISACFSEANHCSRPVLQRPAPVLAEARTRRGFWKTQDLTMWFLSFFFFCRWQVSLWQWW